MALEFNQALGGIDRSVERGQRPQKRRTVTEWSDENRYLSVIASAEPGKWRTDRTPYLKDIMDCLSSQSLVEEVVFMKGSQVGGPLCLSTPIPTAKGWTTMGEIKVGDTVFDELGKQCQVLHVSEVFHGRRCLEITFSDGERVTCDESHVWTVWDSQPGHSGKKRGEVNHILGKRVDLTAGEIERTFKSGNRNRYAIPVTKSLDLPPRKLAIDPYVLGLWLGDGNSCSAQITQNEKDALEMVKSIRAAGYSCNLRRLSWTKGDALNIEIDPRGNDLKRATFHSVLKKEKLLGSKKIPRAYLRSSPSQRMELLRGLMDTDGHITKKGRCEITFASFRLAKDCLELIRSLGLKPKLEIKNDYNRPSAAKRWALFGVHYRIGFKAYADNPVFRLPRKVERLTSRVGGRESETFRRRIIDVREVYSLPVRCIGVSSPSHLYLCGQGMIPTHNTELGLNWVGYLVDDCPGPVLLVQPTDILAKRFSRQRLDRLFRDSPNLHNKIKEKKSRDSSNTAIMKEYDGGIMIISGANSAPSLRSMPIKYLFLDEIDGYPQDVGGEGDPVQLAQKRTNTFSRRKIFKCSTPNIKDRSRIEAAFEASDKRYYYVPCPHCRYFQKIEWGNISWTKGDPNTAHLVCVNCKAKIEEFHKTKMLREGKWVAENPNPDTKVAGFHLSGLYSPVGWYSWKQAAREFLEAKTPERLKVFVNTILGETWKEPGEAPEWQRLFDRREPYVFNRCPEGVLFLTAGIDVQRDRFELEIVGWGEDKQSWSIDYRVINCDTANESNYSLIAGLVNETFQVEGSKHRLPIRLIAIDSGYNTQHVYNFARTQGSKVMPVKGSDHIQTIVGAPSRVDLNYAGKKVPKGVKLWHVGVSPGKSELYGWLNLQKPTEDGEKHPPGFCHFPMYSADYFRGLTAEELTTKKVKGYPRQVWEKVRERNEPLDARVYARAAAYVVGLDRFSDTEWAAMKEAVKISNEPSGPGGKKMPSRGGIPTKPSTFL